MNEYMTVETTNMYGSVCYSLQATADIPNGAVVGKGDLIDGEDSIYKAETDYKKGAYLVANPAWSYDDSSAVNQNEENYTNKANVPFRAYKLGKDMKFTVGNIQNADFKAGDSVEYKDGTWKKTTSTSSFKCRAVKTVGFPYCIGSAGVTVAGDGDNTYGKAIDTRTTKYTIEVVA